MDQDGKSPGKGPRQTQNSLMLSRRECMTAGAAALASLFCNRIADAEEASAVDPRPTLAVTINGRGPYRLIADSAAEGIALSRSVADELGLPPSSETVTVVGSTGSAVRPARRVQSIDTGDLHWRDRRATILDRHALALADGILGLAGLPGLVAHYRFGPRTASIQPSGERDVVDGPTGRPALRLPITLRRGNVPCIDVECRDASGRIFKLVAVVDTGAESSVGNAALARLLQQSATVAAAGNRPLTGSSGETIIGSDVALTGLRVGTIEWEPTRIRCADLPAFRDWGLDAAPALLMGVDLLARLGELRIDADRRELRA